MSSPQAGTGGALLEALRQSGDRPPPPKVQAEAELFFLRIGEMLFAFDAAHIAEVIRLPPITRVPGAPNFLLGVGAHRGEVLPVVDLAPLLRLGNTAVSVRTRAAITRSDGIVVAIIADQLEGLRWFKAAAIAPPPVGGEGAVEFLSGVVTDPRGSISIIDLPRLLSVARAQTVAR